MAKQDHTVRNDAAPRAQSTAEPTTFGAQELPEYARPAVRMTPLGGFRPDVTPPAPAKPKPGRRAVILTVLGVSVLVASITLGPTVWQVMRQNGATLKLPDSTAGLTRDTSASAAETADYLMTVLEADIDLDQTASVIYSDPSGGPAKSVMVFGGTTLLMSPERELDTVLTLMNDKTGEVAGLHQVDAGTLGGVMKCGSADSPEGAMAVCGWADHGSIALAFFPNRTPDESAPLLREIRNSSLTR